MARILFYFTIICIAGSVVNSSSVWTWKCQNGRCQKQPLASDETPKGIATCKLTCDANGILWPRPKGRVELGKSLQPINIDYISIIGSSDEYQELSEEVENLFDEAADIFRQQITSLVKKGYNYAGKSLDVQVTIHNAVAKNLKMTTDESYELQVSQKEDGNILVVITSAEFFGARHALETLSQLIAFDDVSGEVLIVQDVTITDAPALSYRSLGLDTSRNYFSVASIKRTLDGMAASKLNSFHWHITDSHSFPFQSVTYPQLTEYGAYSPSQIYTPEDIQSIVQYALVRGIRVVPEIDAPAHVGEGWQPFGPSVTVCVNAQPWSNYCVEPPCGQLNPLNDTVYEVLGGIYRDIFQLFDSDIFHMGGDEVNFGCWRSVEEIVNWMTANGMGQTDDDFLQLWDIFQKKAYDKAVEAKGGDFPAILWTSHLTSEGAVDKYLDNSKYIIQIWTTGADKVIAELVNKGFRVIFSNYDTLYFDCGFGAWVGEGNNWCSPYSGWQKVYMNDPFAMLTNLGVDVSEGSPARALVLGAEAALWTEEVDENSLDGRFWPKAAALAERLWTNPQESWQEAEYRMLAHRERLVQRGIKAEALEPQWCYQNEGNCPLQ